MVDQVMEGDTHATRQQSYKQKFNFLGFPEDVRRQIYRYLLVRQTPLKPLQNVPIKRYFKATDEKSLLLSAGIRLFRSCKVVFEEASQIFYGDNRFSLRPDHIHQILEFMTKISTRNYSKLTHLSLDFEWSQERNFKKWEIGLKDDNGLLRRLLMDSEYCRYEKRESLDDEDEWQTTGIGLYQGYPRWNNVRRLEESQEVIAQALASLCTCSSLRNLNIVFPDPQRHALGLHCLIPGSATSRIMRQIKVIDEVNVCGVDELGALGDIAKIMDVPRFTAELRWSDMRPSLHVEAGRPNLRAYPGWRVISSSEQVVVFERCIPKNSPKDTLSTYPTEILYQIFGHFIDRSHLTYPICEYYDHYYGFLRKYFVMTHKTCPGVKRATLDDISFLCTSGLVGMSKKLYYLAIELLYRYSIFISCSGEPDTMLIFLSLIGSANRKKVRNVLIDWERSITNSIRWLIPYPDSDNEPVNGEWAEMGVCTTQSVNEIKAECLSKIFRTLKMLQELPELEWLFLALPIEKRLYTYPFLQKDLFENDRFFYACSRIKVKYRLWVGYTGNLVRAENLGRAMSAAEVCINVQTQHYAHTLVTEIERRGWTTQDGYISKLLEVQSKKSKRYT